MRDTWNPANPLHAAAHLRAMAHEGTMKTLRIDETRPRSRRKNWLVDLLIAAVLIVIGGLIACAGCDTERACTCDQFCVRCGGVKCTHCPAEKPVRVESPDIPPVEHAKPPDPDKLIGGVKQTTQQP